MLGDTGFFNELLTFDASTVTDEQIQVCRKAITLTKITAEGIRKCSNAAAGLFEWVEEILSIKEEQSSQANE